MAKNRNRRRAPAAVAPSLALFEAELRDHVDRLGIASPADYFVWCRRHGFSTGVRKSSAMLVRERAFAEQLAADDRLRAGVRVRNPVEAVRRLLAGEAVAGSAHDALLAALREADGDPAPARRACLVAVLRHLADVLPDSLAPNGLGVRVARHVAEHHAAVAREIAAWRPRTHNDGRALGAFVDHVFARYAAPVCLRDAWLETGDAAALHRRWYLHLVAGGNLRTAPRLPFPLTKRMAHECLAVPAELGAFAMLRWGQVRALGGGERLARALIATRLGHDFAHDAFWQTFVAFCVRYATDDVHRVTAWVDFLHEHRHGVRVVVDERGRTSEVPPPQPNLAMAGRTPESLQKQVDAWHGALGKADAGDRLLRWPAVGLPGYAAVTDAGTPNEATWRVRELCSAVELRLESAAMRHCVYTYTARCARREAAIFTLARHTRARVESMVTMEVQRSRIVQARGVANQAPPTAACEHMRRWASGAGLTIASWV